MNKKVQYGLMLCHYLAVHGQTSIAKVADELAIPYEFLEQIATHLRRSGIIQSTRGPGGGYDLVPSSTVGAVLTALGFRPTGTGEASSDWTSSRDFLNTLCFSLYNAMRPLLGANFKTLAKVENFDVLFKPKMLIPAQDLRGV